MPRSPFLHHWPAGKAGGDGKAYVGIPFQCAGKHSIHSLLVVFGREVQLPIELMFGRRPTPVETHGDYVTHLKERMEAVYGVVCEHLCRQLDTKSSVMTGRLLVDGTRWVTQSGSIPKGRTPKFHRPWKGAIPSRKDPF